MAVCAPPRASRPKVEYHAPLVLFAHNRRCTLDDVLLLSSSKSTCRHAVDHVPAFAPGMHAKLRASGPKADLALVVCDVDATVAGTFTLNVMCAAPVTYCKEVLERRETVRAVRLDNILLCCYLFFTRFGV